MTSGSNGMESRIERLLGFCIMLTCQSVEQGRLVYAKTVVKWFASPADQQERKDTLLYKLPPPPITDGTRFTSAVRP